MEMVILTEPQLRTLFRSEINEALNRQGNTLAGAGEDQILKRSDVAELFDVSLVTVHAWMNSGQLKFHRIGGRTYFKKKEVMDSLKSIKIRRKT